VRSGLALVFAFALGGCPSPYRHGDLPRAAQLGCLELDANARYGAIAPGVQLDWRIGNACDDAIPIDLGAARITAIAADGTRTALAPYDPRHEIHATWLPAGTDGAESILYVPGIETKEVEIALVGVAPEAREQPRSPMMRVVLGVPYHPELP